MGRNRNFTTIIGSLQLKGRLPGASRTFLSYRTRTTCISINTRVQPTHDLHTTNLNGKNILFTGLPKLASAIQQKHVEVDIEIKRTAKTLDERYRVGTRGSVDVPAFLTGCVASVR